MVHASSERLAELKAFDEAKTGVKGLVDAGVSKVPSIFIHSLTPSLASPPSPKPSTSISIPVIDLSGIKGGSDPSRKDLVGRIRDASEKWGFFQVVNHGIPILVLESMLEGVRGFFEQDDEVKKSYYSRDYNNGKVAYNSNFDLYTGPVANWRDTFFCMMAPSLPHLEDLPSSCR